LLPNIKHPTSNNPRAICPLGVLSITILADTLKLE
jgi:hypothetical protein